MDGSFLTIPNDSLVSLDAHWIIENEGVAPDIAVEPPPDEAVTHQDSELNAGIKAALEQLGENPPLVLKAPDPLPAYPPAAGNVPGATFDSSTPHPRIRNDE